MIKRVEKFFNFVVFTILNHPGCFMVYYLFGVFFYLCKVSFSGFYQFKGNFVDAQNTVTLICCFKAEKITRLSKSKQNGGQLNMVMSVLEL